MTRVYRDKTAEVRIMQFSLECSPMPAHCDTLFSCALEIFLLTYLLSSLPAKLDSEIRRGPLDREAETGVGWFSIEFATLYLGNGVR